MNEVFTSPLNLQAARMQLAAGLVHGNDVINVWHVGEHAWRGARTEREPCIPCKFPQSPLSGRKNGFVSHAVLRVGRCAISIMGNRIFDMLSNQSSVKKLDAPAVTKFTSLRPRPRSQ